MKRIDVKNVENLIQKTKMINENKGYCGDKFISAPAVTKIIKHLSAIKKMIEAPDKQSAIVDVYNDYRPSREVLTKVTDFQIFDDCERAALLSIYGYAGFVPNTPKIDFAKRVKQIIKESNITQKDLGARTNISEVSLSRMLNLLAKESIPNRQIRRNTVYRLVIGLRLNEKSALELMAVCGYCLSDYNPVDVVILAQLQKYNYDAYKIDQILKARRLPMLFDFYKNK